MAAAIRPYTQALGQSPAAMQRGSERIGLLGGHQPAFACGECPGA